MALQISIDTNMTAFVEMIEAFNTNLNTVSNKYEQDANSLSTSVSNVDFGSWQDDVSTVLDTYLKNGVKTGCIDVITRDLTSGGMKQMKTITTRLLQDAVNLPHSKERYLTNKEKLKLPKYVDSGRKNEAGEPIMKLNPNRPSEDVVAAYERELNELIRNVNLMLKDLSTIDFNKTVTTSDIEDVTLVLDPIDGGNGDEEGFEPFEDDDSLVTQTTTVTGEDGKEVEVTIVINPDNGNYLIVNPDGEIIIVCTREDGTVYAGVVMQPKEGPYDVTNPEIYGLISDNHENTQDSSMFDTYSEQSYGERLGLFRTQITPLHADGENTQQSTVTINGQEVTLTHFNSDNAFYNPYFNDK
jgi:hypothetical protein